MNLCVVVKAAAGLLVIITMFLALVVMHCTIFAKLQTSDVDNLRMEVIRNIVNILYKGTVTQWFSCLKKALAMCCMMTEC